MSQLDYGMTAIVRSNLKGAAEASMSKKTLDIPGIKYDVVEWAKQQLEELKAEIAASEDLTEEEKRYLYDLDQLPEDQWEPVTCEGEPVSETIIRDRGEK